MNTTLTMKVLKGDIETLEKKIKTLEEKVDNLEKLPLWKQLWRKK